MSEDLKKMCTFCKENKAPSEFHVRATQCKQCRRVISKQYHLDNKTHRNNLCNKRTEFINQKIFSIIGEVCAACGEADQRLLTVDHVNNDRKLERHYNSLTWKYDIINHKVDTKKYQVLCRSCNEAKQRKGSFNLTKKRKPTNTYKQCSVCCQNMDTCYFGPNSYVKKGIKRSTLRSECCFCINKRNFKITIDCYNYFGGFCVKCGQNDHHKLNIDHVNNDGHIYRKEHGTGGKICRKILNGELDKKLFQLLCANCNYRKMHTVTYGKGDVNV